MRNNVRSNLCWVVLAVLTIALSVRIAVKSEFSAALLPVAFAPAAGLQHSLPKRVIEALPLLHRHGVERYRLSDSILQEREGWLHQRFIEASYPMRLENDARYLVTFAEESPAATCRLVEKGALIALYDCPAS